MRGEIKSNKNTRILSLYQMLLNGEYVFKTSYSLEHNITERTFERDIAEIRNFLSDIFSNRELIYDKSLNAYHLSGKTLKYLDKMDATILIKVLLESRCLRIDELEGLIDKLILTVNQNDVKDIVSYLHKDLTNYESLNSKSILKLLNDLYLVIDRGCDIEIVDDEGSSRTISPIRIELNGSNFQLIAKELNLESNYIEIDVEDISYFKMLNTNFAKNIKQEYFKEREEYQNGN